MLRSISVPQFAQVTPVSCPEGTDTQTLCGTVTATVHIRAYLVGGGNSATTSPRATYSARLHLRTLDALPHTHSSITAARVGSAHPRPSTGRGGLDSSLRDESGMFVASTPARGRIAAMVALRERLGTQRPMLDPRERERTQSRRRLSTPGENCTFLAAGNCHNFGRGT